MSDQVRAKRGRGPLGKSTNRPIVDRGTLAKTQHRPPVKEAHDPKPSSWEIAAKKIEYLEYARTVSYIMQAKSEGDSAVGWVEEELKQLGVDDGKSKPRRVQSFLGGAYLRMYLDGKTDPDVIRQAGIEIGESAEFARLSKELNEYLQGQIDQLHLSKAAPDKLLMMADRHLKAIKSKGGIAFRTTLNAVIGGVTDVSVDSVTHREDASTPKGTASKYRVGITFYDTYDFENKRYGEYDRYRKELARFLLADDFAKFEEAYSREAHHPFDRKMHKTRLDNAAVFASYMYALEKKKWTPGGLAWNVTVPTEITLVFKPPHGHR